MSVNLALWKKGRSLGFVLFFVFLLPINLPAESESRSPWALGLGTGWLSDYPGAAQGRIRFLPFPVYRGSVFRIDRISGVSGDVYNNSKLDFSWNFIFQFPTESDQIPVRQGMPDLDWLLSLGPQFKYYFYRSSHHKLFFRIPVFTFRWEAFSHSSEFQQYFFEVQPQYATAARPTFHARAGFLGFVYGMFHTLPFDGWNISTALNLYDYSLAINDESPLFVHKTNYAVFVAITVDLF